MVPLKTEKITLTKKSFDELFEKIHTIVGEAYDQGKIHGIEFADTKSLRAKIHYEDRYIHMILAFFLGVAISNLIHAIMMRYFL